MTEFLIRKIQVEAIVVLQITVFLCKLVPLETKGILGHFFSPIGSSYPLLGSPRRLMLYQIV